jgi:hypothetical protein
MKRLSAITAQRAMHCQQPSGFGGKLVLFAFEAQYRLSHLTLDRKSILGCIAGWVNPDQWNRSGRCRLNLSPN